MLVGLAPRAISAQDASPVATPAPTPLLDALGYPTLEVSYDGTTLTAPAELTAGRYRLVFTNTSGNPAADMEILGPPKDMSRDEFAAELAKTDPASSSAPSWFFDATLLGGTDNSSPAVIDLPPGEWLVGVMPFSEQPQDMKPLSQPLTVTGDMPGYPAIDGAVQVQLADFLIGMPDTLPAGPTIFEVTNSGLVPHFIAIMKASGPITTEEAVNGVKIFMGMPDATPVASGSAADPSTFANVVGTDPTTNGGTVLTETNLEPGTYIAFCFVEGPGDIGSHALHGMTKVFTVA